MSVPERHVRFTEQFFDHLDQLLPSPDIRVFIGARILVRRFAIYVALEAATIEAFWLTIDFHRPDDFD